VRLLIIPDKFKGTLTAGQAAAAIARGWQRARPRDNLDLVPMGDGGDGFGEVFGNLLGAKLRRLRAVDASHRPCTAPWWWEPKSRTAIIESAKIIGLAMLPPSHPFALDTLGLGIALRKVARTGAKRCLLGIGGSATNDGGFGLARALGWSFLNRAGAPIERWTELHSLVRVMPPPRHVDNGRQFPRGVKTGLVRPRGALGKARPAFMVHGAASVQPLRSSMPLLSELVIAVDVRNPLLGARGATRVYGPQKGLPPRDFAHAEGCLRRLAQVVNQILGQDLAAVPGAGAAGGLGFGLLAFAGGHLEPGFELFAKHANLDRRLRQGDLVITGEGAIDDSTLMGKGVGQIAKRCRQLKVPCIGLAGMVGLHPSRHPFERLQALTELTSLAQAKTRPGFWLERLAEQAASNLP
jgi:glycerate kinase